MVVETTPISIGVEGTIKRTPLEPRKDVVASDHLKRKDGGQRCRFSGNDKRDVKPDLQGVKGI